MSFKKYKNRDAWSFCAFGLLAIILGTGWILTKQYDQFQYKIDLSDFTPMKVGTLLVSLIFFALVVERITEVYVSVSMVKKRTLAEAPFAAELETVLG